MDAKGRVSLPIAYRDELRRRSDRPSVITNMLDCLALFSRADWEAYVGKLRDVNEFRLEGQELQRFVISGASDISPDSQGRIQIPQYLREHAHLEKDLIIAGVGQRIEIWDKARFEQELVRTRAQFREISTEVSKIGN
jgi:MraZ protein